MKKIDEKHSPQKHDEDILYDLLGHKGHMPDLSAGRSLPEIDFNLSKDNLEKVNDIGELVIGRKYLVNVRIATGPSFNYLGIFNSSDSNYIYFLITKQRSRRRNVDGPYDKWERYPYDTHAMKQFAVNGFNKDYYIYKVPDFINNITSTDDVEQIIRNEHARQQRETYNTLNMMFGEKATPSSKLTNEAMPITDIMSFLARGRKSRKPKRKLNRKSRRKSISKRPLKYF